jgi:hypothetical protein
MPRFVDQGVKAVDVILLVVEQDIWPGIITARRIGAAALAPVFIAVHPSGQQSVFKNTGIFISQWLHGPGTHFHGLFVGHVELNISDNRNIGIVKMKLLQSQGCLPKVQIFKERGEVISDGFDKIIIDGLVNVVTEKGGSTAALKISGPAVKKVFLNGVGQGGRQGVLMILVNLIILKKDLPADVRAEVD